MLAQFYRIISYPLWSLLLPWLRWRAKKRGTHKRWGERLGRPSVPHPDGAILWFHAASLGETHSLFPLIGQILEVHPNHHVLITTTTASSAECVSKQQKIPEYHRLIHQYIPFDHPRFVINFLSHWKPRAAFFAESELWPNLIAYTKSAGIPLALINARISDRSFKRWQNPLAKNLISSMLKHFDLTLAQDETSAKYLQILGAKDVKTPGNLKFAAPPLPADTKELARLKVACRGRQIWLAASTHPGEEEILASVHLKLKADFPNVLSVCVPRHATRGDEIVSLLQSHNLLVAQRSKNQLITSATDIYLADSFGELGLFYRLCPISFIGGSLVRIGGHNPLEAARLRSVVVQGPYAYNFKEISASFCEWKAGVVVANDKDLKRQLAHLFTDKNDTAALVDRASQMLSHLDDACKRTYHLIHPLWN